MTRLTMSRGFLYLAGLLAGLAALTGYAEFDPATWMLDIQPFNLREFVLTAITTFGNALAAFAVSRGWGGR